MTRRRSRICWFVDLEMLDERRTLLERMRDEIGLTTVVPESHISHTSGFRASPAIADSSPLRDWRSRPGLAAHREVFGVAEPAFPVVPGVLGGFDDAPLLRVTEECRRLGLEVWGHAGVWCYAGEVFPEYAAVDLWGRPLTPGSLPWGTSFCPSKPDLHEWMLRSLADAAARYDLDGWFLDHARATSPGHLESLFACACGLCAEAARGHGVELGICRDDLTALAVELRKTDPAGLVALAAGGPVAFEGWLARYPGVLAWFRVRARILADRFAEIGAALRAASSREIEYGSDVFPPGVALLGGHVYGWWGESATWLTGGFGGRIGWGSVHRVMVESLGPRLAAAVPGLDPQAAGAIVASLVGAPAGATEADDVDVLLGELRRVAGARGSLPVYPPLPVPPDLAALERICDGIVQAGLDGAMFAGLERATDEQLGAIRGQLTARLPA